MSVQLREGIWRMRDGFVTTIYWMPETEGQEAHWGNYLGEWNSDGKTCYTDTDSVDDLVEYLGPIPKTDWSADIARLRAEWQAEFTAAQQLRSENERLQAEIERLRGELLQSEARNTADADAAEYAARLEGLLDNSREALRDLQEDHTALDNRAEGARSAYLAVIKTLWEMRR